MIELSERAETAEEGPQLELLPVQFHPLIPTIRKWALTDDLERSDLLDAAPIAVLRSLADEVPPYLEAINSFLDSFGENAPTEEAASSGGLAESAAQAKQRLDAANVP